MKSTNAPVNQYLKISCNNHNVKENTYKNTGLYSIAMALEGGHYATWTNIRSMLHTYGFTDVYNNAIGQQQTQVSRMN